jgi:ribosomal protein L40E
MYEGTELDDCLLAIREQVCTRCIERPPGGPPCAPLGKRSGIEVKLERLIEAVHAVRSPAIDPCIAEFHDEVCMHCEYRLPATTRRWTTNTLTAKRRNRELKGRRADAW